MQPRKILNPMFDGLADSINKGGNTLSVKTPLGSKLDMDFYMSNTPDLPELRYCGPIPVFIYGPLQMWSNIEDLFKKHGMSMGKDWQSRVHSAQTNRNFYMYRNLSTTKSAFAWIQDNVVFAAQPMTKNFHRWTDEPCPVRGRIITVSLRGLLMLDQMFDNRRSSFRINVDTYNTLSPAEKHKVWFYQHNPNQILKESNGVLHEALNYKLYPYPQKNTTGVVKHYYGQEDNAYATQPKVKSTISNNVTHLHS